MAPTSILFYKEVGHSQEGAKEVTALFGDKGVFDGPKPVRLLERLLTLANLNDDSIVLDFFSGSATTAQALMKRNTDKGTHCKFILVQLPEKVSDTKKNQGFSTICEVGKERIRRAGRKVKEEAGLQGAGLDIGFRVLKLDSSNMEDVYYTPDKFDPSLLDSLVSNIKADRTNEDLMFQVMLDLGIELSARVERKEIAGKEVLSVDGGYLLACFDTDVNETTIEEMARLQPVHLVIRNASAANDNVLDNFDQIIETYSSERRITTHVL